MNKETVRQVLYFSLIIALGFQLGITYMKYGYNIDRRIFDQLNFVIREDSVIIVHPNPNTTEGFQISQKNIIYYEE